MRTPILGTGLVAILIASSAAASAASTPTQTLLNPPSWVFNLPDSLLGKVS